MKTENYDLKTCFTYFSELSSTDCGPVESISNGRIDLEDPSNTTYDDTAVVMCDPGFDASLDQVTCLSNGSWSESTCTPKGKLNLC